MKVDGKRKERGKEKRDGNMMAPQILYSEQHASAQRFSVLNLYQKLPPFFKSCFGPDMFIFLAYLLFDYTHPHRCFPCLDTKYMSN